MAPRYYGEELTFARRGRASRLFMAAEEMRMPKTRDLDSWRAYIEDGNREFCEHERTILKKYIRRITSCHKKMLFPERFRRDRATTIALWIQYIEARQTPAEAAERSRSLVKHEGKNGAIGLKIARKKLFAEIEANPALTEHIRRRRYGDEDAKNFDFSSGRPPRRRGHKDRPLRGPIPKRYPTPKTTHQPPVAVDDTPIAPQFSFNFAIQQPATFLLRNDPQIGKYMVKQGRESPLRQSISLHQAEDQENQVLNIEAQVGWTVDALKGQIAGFETKNLVHRTRYPLSNIRQTQRLSLDGL